MTATLEILERLIAFDTVSAKSNLALIEYVEDLLAGWGYTVTRLPDPDGQKAGLLAQIGPAGAGILLSAHTDVVPVEGQTWASDPFTLTRRGDRLYGRGSVDMKGFLACVLASVPRFQAAGLTRPIHIAFSYDEETGGYGMPVLLRHMAGKAFRPAVVIVGEPTEMKIITGHKGG